MKQEIFDKILTERPEVDLTADAVRHTITVRVKSDYVGESVDAEGKPVRGPLYPMANTIRNQYASSDVMPTTLADDEGVRWTSYEFGDNPTSRALLEMEFGGTKLKYVILAYGGQVIYSDKP